MLFVASRIADIDEKECREALLDFVTESSCYGQTPAQQMKITAIKPATALHVRNPLSRISLSCLGAIICDINTVGFVSVSCTIMQHYALVVMLCNRSLGDATAHEQQWALQVVRRSASAHNALALIVSCTACYTYVVFTYSPYSR